MYYIGRLVDFLGHYFYRLKLLTNFEVLFINIILGKLTYKYVKLSFHLSKVFNSNHLQILMPQKTNTTQYK